MPTSRAERAITLSAREEPRREDGQNRESTTKPGEALNLLVAADCNIDRVEAHAWRDRHTEKVFQPLP